MLAWQTFRCSDGYLQNFFRAISDNIDIFTIPFFYYMKQKRTNRLSTAETEEDEGDDEEEDEDEPGTKLV